MNKIIKNKSGNSAVSFAIILPLLLLIILAVIEFGLYFIKDQITLNAIAATSDQLRSNPNDANTESDSKNYGGKFVNYITPPNYFCAESYETAAEAEAAVTGIEANDNCNFAWNTTRPVGLDESEPYFIALAAKTEKFKVAISDYLPNIQRTAVVKVYENAFIPRCEKGEQLVMGDDDWECAETEKVQVLETISSVNIVSRPNGQSGLSERNINLDNISGVNVPDNATHAVVNAYCASYNPANAAYIGYAGGQAVCRANGYGAGNKTDSGYGIVPLESDGKNLKVYLRKDNSGGAVVINLDGFIVEKNIAIIED